MRPCVRSWLCLLLIGSYSCCLAEYEGIAPALLSADLSLDVALPAPGITLERRLKPSPVTAPYLSDGPSPSFRPYIRPLERGLGIDKTTESGTLSSLVQLLGLDQGNAVSAMCVVRTGDAPGLGVRWSFNDGFGFYVQGRGFMQLRRVLSSKQVNFCPPGDGSLTCRSLPRRICE